MPSLEDNMFIICIFSLSLLEIKYFLISAIFRAYLAHVTDGILMVVFLLLVFPFTSQFFTILINNSSSSVVFDRVYSAPYFNLEDIHLTLNFKVK